VFLFCLWFALPTFAQTEEPVVAPIEAGSTVTETITADAAFDWWRFYGVSGELYRAQMLTEDGLQPLLGVIDSGGNLIMRSDQGGTDTSSQADLARIEFTIPADGEFTLVASGANDTTGSYRLTLQRLQEAQVDPAALTVTFPCNGRDVAALSGIQFRQDEGDMGSYPVFIYGADGLQPVIRFEVPEQAITACIEHADDADGDRYTFPDGDTFLVSTEQPESASLLTINAESNLGQIIITFGAADETRGRYIALIGGFHLEPGDEGESVQVRLAPLPAQTSGLTIYMIGVGENSRLDPFLTLGDEAGNTLSTCDDAGRRGCDDVLPISGAGITLSNSTPFVGDRFDAGVFIPAGNTDWHTITPGSFGGNTTGNYALLIVGEYPAE
jgi:hypothetical protein